MKLTVSALCATAFVAFMASGCIDDDYDLSEIDGTTEFKLKELVLPLNLDEITLSNVLELNESSQVKIVNGEYVLFEDGVFSAQNIKIPEIVIPAPQVDPTRQLISLDMSQFNPSIKAFTVPSEFRYSIEPTKGSSFSYSVGDVSDYITSIDGAKVDMSISIDMSVTDLDEFITGFEFCDMIFQFPKGLTLEYDTEKFVYDDILGIFKFKDGVSVRTDGTSYSLPIKVHSIDFDKANATYDGSTHVLTFADEVAIIGGQACLSETDIKPGQSLLNLPKEAYFELGFQFSDLKVLSVSGGVEYALEGIDIAPIKLNNIPDFINQPGTNITLKNPQLYMSANNPVAPYGLAPEMGMTITQVRNGTAGNSYSIDNGSFLFGKDKGNVEYQYCLSPAAPQVMQSGYENAEHIAFTGLSDIVSGDGIPSALNVSIDRPNITGKTEDFALGQELQLSGSYLFYAPLDLAAGSTICYTKTKTGWGDEDIKRLTIYEMVLTANVTSDVPFSVTLEGYPINSLGNKVEAEVEPVEIAANAKEEEIALRIYGNIQDLDGITFSANAVADGSKPFSPDQKLVLKNVKVKISGSYIEEL